MPSLGQKTVRAFLKGANDSAPQRTKMVQLPEVKSVGEPTLDDVFESTHKSRNDDLRALPYKAEWNRAKYNRLTSQLLDLVEEGIPERLDAFSRKHFGRSWATARQMPAVKSMLEGYA